MEEFEDISIVIRRSKRSKTIKLELNNRELTSLPQSLFDLTHLIKLDLSDNSLTSISKRIGELKSLEIVNFSNNQLQNLPK
jgi:Leucine-rich repeat (LRR) protein